MKSKETFASQFDAFLYHYDLPVVFDDFLTMSIAACGKNPHTGLSYDEELYIATVEKYKTDPLRFQFPKLLQTLTDEMTERKLSSKGNDVMGEFYEVRLAKKGLSQFFTPYPICDFMAKSAIEEASKNEHNQPLRILDPACGSGRFLVSAAEVTQRKELYFGIDIDLTCVRMTVLNLFLNGIFHAEVLCTNFLLPNEFRGSYVTSLVPFGIFRIKEKEKSLLWHMMQHHPPERPEQKLPSEQSSGEKFSPDNSQLTLF